MKKYFLQIAIILFTAIALSSCGPTRVVVANRPSAPVYARPAAPGPAYVWVSGEWIRQNGNYTWREGYWAPRLHNRNGWVEGHWSARKGGWYWVPGHWR